MKQLKNVLLGGMLISMLIIAACSSAPEGQRTARGAGASQTVRYNAARDFTVEQIDGGTAQVITGYFGSDARVYIPPKIYDLPVKGIGERAFAGRMRITAVIIPEGVNSIGAEAFMDSRNLQSVTIPASVSTIAARAFQSCLSLTSVTIPGSVTRIGPEAFFSCANLATVIIQDGVLNIGTAAFQGCLSLQSITIPSSVTRVSDNAFAGCQNLTSVTFNGVIVANNVSSIQAFPGDLRAKFLAGGKGAYRRTANSPTWTRS